MLIKKIKLSNFRCYQNDEIEFSIDKDKNVTVIVGNNRAGKTTLLNAFSWCLYGVHKFATNYLLNKDTELSMNIGDTEYVTVVLDVTHDGYDYRISTNEAYTKSAEGSVTKTKNATTTVTKKDSKTGQTYPFNGNDAINEINSILPEQLSQYFFLAGEDVNTVTKKSNLSKAVRQILGLESIREGISYFSSTNGNSVYNTIRKDMELSSNKDSIEDSLYQREQKFAAIDECEDIIERSRKEYENYIARREKIESELDANKDVAQYQQQKSTANYDLNKANKAMNESYDNLMKIINEYASQYMLSYSYVKHDLSEKLSKSNLINRPSVTHISEQAIDDIIKRGFCICGCQINNNTDAYNHLIEEKKYIPPRDYSANVRAYLNGETITNSYMPDIYKNIYRHGGEYLQAINDYEEAEELLKDVNSKLEGRKDVGQLARDLRECNEQIRIFDSRISSNSGKLEILKKDLANLDAKISQLEVQNDKNKKIKTYLAYCDQIKLILEKTLVNKTKDAREKLKNKVQELYDQMFVGNKCVEISDDFNVITFDPKSGKLDETGGTEAIKNFAFIGGLTSLAKDLSLNTESDDLEGPQEVYPLILDAPFSHTDEIHTASSAKILPLTSEQIIFIVMRKDFVIAEPYLSNKIGAKYTIKNEHETLTILTKEVC